MTAPRFAQTIAMLDNATTWSEEPARLSETGMARGQTRALRTRSRVVPVMPLPLSSSPRRGLAPIGLIAIGFAGSTIVTPLYAFYQDRFGFSTIVLTLVYAAYVIGNTGGLLFLGRLSDWVGRRPVAVGAIVLAMLSAGLFLFAQGTPWLFLARAVSGLSVGLASGTGTAWLVDINPDDRERAALSSTLANMAGIGLAPLAAGLLAQFAPGPLVLPFLIYWLVVGAVLIAVLRARETVKPRPVDMTVLRPQVALPPGARATFIAPAATGFAIFAFVGYYVALLPTILRQAMHVSGPAVGGTIVAELFAVAALLIVATRRMSSQAAMFTGLATMMPALVLITLAQTHHSLVLLILATACGGVALATGYRGSLVIVNEIAPPDARAGLVSVYLLICFIGNSLPVIGIAAASRAVGPIVAGEMFAGLMATIALLAMFAGWRCSRPSAADVSPATTR